MDAKRLEIVNAMRVRVLGENMVTDNDGFDMQWRFEEDKEQRSRIGLLVRWILDGLYEWQTNLEKRMSLRYIYVS